MLRDASCRPIADNGQWKCTAVQACLFLRRSPPLHRLGDLGGSTDSFVRLAIRSITHSAEAGQGAAAFWRLAQLSELVQLLEKKIDAFERSAQRPRPLLRAPAHHSFK